MAVWVLGYNNQITAIMHDMSLYFPPGLQALRQPRQWFGAAFRQPLIETVSCHSNRSHSNHSPSAHSL
eukprot:351575-Chlamydomonas_euryale.AAC.5